MFTVALLVLFSVLCILLSGDGAWDNVTKPSRNALVFEGRPKDYGAFALRREYSRRFIIAFSGALTIVSLAVIVPKLLGSSASRPPSNGYIPPFISDTIIMVFPDPPEPKPTTTTTSSSSGSTITPTEILVVDSLPLLPDTASKRTTDPDTSSLVAAGPIGVPVKPGGGGGGKGGEDAVDSTYMSVALPFPPEFPGGDRALLRFIQENTVFPEDALNEGVNEKIYVEFVVEKDGSISGVKVVRGSYPSLKREAARVLRSMPRWSPGRMNDHTVRCRLVQPVNFTVRQ